MPQLNKRTSIKSLNLLFYRRTKRAKNGCLIWLGSKTATGYGRLHFMTTTVAAHRVAYELHNSGIDEGLLVCHKCDNPSCVEHTHLFQGTSKENQQDMVQKMRGRFGERNGRAITTMRRVRAIRKKYATGTYTQQEIGKLYDLTQITISNIVTRRTWKHI